MIITRRTFVKSCASASIAGAFGLQGCVSFGREETYPGWKPGEMDLHFVYTGCGENMFYRLPDGTSILNDTGDYYRPRDLSQVPLLPSPERLGGEWMSRYVSRVYPEKVIDYLIFSHWHSDHIGHMVYDRAETPAEAYRFRTLPDGRRINGFLCVADMVAVVMGEDQIVDRLLRIDARNISRHPLSAEPRSRRQQRNLLEIARPVIVASVVEYARAVGQTVEHVFAATGIDEMKIHLSRLPPRIALFAADGAAPVLAEDAEKRRRRA
jgi:hypothetical protein